MNANAHDASGASVGLPHHIVRLVCLIGAAISPVLAALVCKHVAKIGANHVVPQLPDHALPVLTQTWIAGIAEGRFPLIIVAATFSAILAGSGGSVLISKRMSPASTASSVLVICCVGYTMAVAELGSTLLAFALPFLGSATD